MAKEVTTIYSVGELAKMLDIPMSTLYYYDRQKLLIPSFRDKKNNYRYYTQEQVMEALYILKMRRLNMPVKEIKTMLKRRHLKDLNETLEKTRLEIEKEIGALQYKYDYVKLVQDQLHGSLSMLEQSPNAAAADAPPFEYLRVAEQTVLAKTIDTSFFVSKDFFSACVELQNLIEKHQLRVDGVLTMVFLDAGVSEEERFKGAPYKARVQYPVEAAGSLKADGAGRFGGFEVISCLHIGHYPLIPPVYARLKHEIARKKLKVIGPPFEQYLADCTYVNQSSNYITRVCYPIAR